MKSFPISDFFFLCFFCSQISSNSRSTFFISDEQTQHERTPARASKRRPSFPFPFSISPLSISSPSQLSNLHPSPSRSLRTLSPFQSLAQTLFISSGVTRLSSIHRSHRRSLTTQTLHRLHHLLTQLRDPPLKGSMEEIPESQVSLAAPLIFIFMVVLQLIPCFLERVKKRGSQSAEQVRLLQEIKALSKEASSLSNPSTFAQAAKLKRMSAAKERELLKIQELQNKENKVSYDAYLNLLTKMKVGVYVLLIFWFWGNPVAAVPQKFLQPFGRVLSMSVGDPATGRIMVGIIPWLMISNRVSKFICQKLTKLC